MRATYCTFLLLGGYLANAYALNPTKAITQYSTTVWGQEHGLPQNTIRAITQTADGFLWIGTDEGLARFDGYEFVIVGREQGQLPSNSITALAAGQDGSLWVGTPNGVTRYSNQHFRTYTEKDGLPANPVSSLFVDHSGVVWIVASGDLSRFDGSRFTNLIHERDIPMRALRSVSEDGHHVLYLAGTSSVVRFENGRFLRMFDPSVLQADFPSQAVPDHNGNLWIAGLKGLIRRWPNGRVSRLGPSQGLSYSFGISAIKEDRDGNLWVGTDHGLARREGDRFRMLGDGLDQAAVRCIFEDKEGNLWVGTNRGLRQFRDEVFTVFGKREGLPSDEPNVVFKDRSGDMWAGFADTGLMRFPAGDPSRAVAAGPREGRVYSIRQARNGDLLVGHREGFTRWRNGESRTFVPPDPQGRKRVFDALEDAAGRIWLALPNGLGQLQGDKFRYVVPAASPVMSDSAFATLAEGSNGVLWAGTSQGLWQVGPSGNRLYTTADGLSSNQIRSLYSDPQGTLWIGTLGGGLNVLRDGHFHHFTARDGLLSDNISSMVDDGHALWLSTTRGICQVSKTQLWEFAGHRITRLATVSYGLPDGLRNVEAPPELGRSSRLSKDSLWFPTVQGIAVYAPERPARPNLTPAVYVVELTADGHRVDGPARPLIPPGLGRIELRYSAIHLSAHQRVRYSYRLDGLDADWIEAGSRRGVIYNNLGRGQYRFRVKAEIPDAPPGEISYSFELLPHFYESGWFRSLCAVLVVILGWAAYWFRIRQIRSRFAVVLKERLRLAREIHDTLSQAFIGISAQLDALGTYIPDELRPAHVYLELAQRMAQHSLTEARRSIMDLRSAALNNQNLPAALRSGLQNWTAGSNVNLQVEVEGELRNLPDDVEHNILRIAQESVNNALKHARASKITVRVQRDRNKLTLKVADNGCGFELEDAFAGMGGHFGLIGISERAERIGGELHLDSHLGQGTEVEVTVPLL